MNENSSHVVIHHYFDNFSDIKLIIMICLILGTVVVIILLIILVLVLCMVLQKTKTRSDPHAEFCNVRRQAVSNSYKPPNRRHRTTSNSSPIYGEIIDSNPDVGDVPMSTMTSNTNDRNRSVAPSEQSSTGLCEFLFPSQRAEEVIYEEPPKLLSFAGRVYPAPPEAPPRTESDPATRNVESRNDSLEWDYFESRRYAVSNVSNTENSIVEVCWV